MAIPTFIVYQVKIIIVMLAMQVFIMHCIVGSVMQVIYSKCLDGRFNG